jgi:mono/diheme cytochrome c family protein
MKRVIPIMTSLVLSVTATHVPAQGIGDPENGLAVARNVCSECHAIRKGQARSPNSRAPTFAELATTPGMTVTALSVALVTPHAGMPMFMLTAEQRGNIIAYILSLKEGD